MAMNLNRATDTITPSTGVMSIAGGVVPPVTVNGNFFFMFG